MDEELYKTAPDRDSKNDLISKVAIDPKSEVHSTNHELNVSHNTNLTFHMQNSKEGSIKNIFTTNPSLLQSHDSSNQ